MQDAAVPRQIVFGPEYQGGFWINRFVPSIQQYGFFAVTEKDQSDLQGLPPHFWMYSMLDLRFLYKGIIINHNKNRANLH